MMTLPMLVLFIVLYPSFMNFKTDNTHDARISIRIPNIVLLCTTTQDITFEFTPMNSSSKIKLAECQIEMKMCALWEPTDSQWAQLYKAEYTNTGWMLEIPQDTHTTAGEYTCYETYATTQRATIGIPMTNARNDKDYKCKPCADACADPDKWWQIVCAIVITTAVIIGIYERKRIHRLLRTHSNRGYSTIKDNQIPLEAVHAEGKKNAWTQTDDQSSIQYTTQTGRPLQPYDLCRDVRTDDIHSPAIPHDPLFRQQTESTHSPADSLFRLQTKLRQSPAVPDDLSFRLQTTKNYSSTVSHNPLLEDVVIQKESPALSNNPSSSIETEERENVDGVYSSAFKETTKWECGRDITSYNTKFLHCSGSSDIYIHLLAEGFPNFGHLFRSMLLHCTLYIGIYQISLPAFNIIYMEARTKLELMNTTMKDAVDQQDLVVATLKKVLQIAQKCPGIYSRYFGNKSRIEKGINVLLRELLDLQLVIQTYADTFECSDEFLHQH